MVVHQFILILFAFFIGTNCVGKSHRLAGVWQGEGIADRGHKTSYFCRFHFTLSIDASSFTIEKKSFHCDDGHDGFGYYGGAFRYERVQNTLYENDKPVGTITNNSILIYPSFPNKLEYTQLIHTENRVIYSSQWGSYQDTGNFRAMLRRRVGESETYR